MKKIAFQTAVQREAATLNVRSPQVQKLIQDFEKKMNLEKGDAEWLKAISVGASTYVAGVSYDEIEGAWFPCVIKDDLTSDTGDMYPDKSDAIEQAGKMINKL